MNDGSGWMDVLTDEYFCDTEDVYFCVCLRTKYPCV